jgi:NAD(P)-dependent dehydrogenase (short-subunit alcohol dehydrogenase family)
VSFELELKGRTAIVTGATAGIGWAVTQALVAEGVRVAGIARSSEALARAQSEMKDAFVAVQADVGDRTELADGLDAAIRQLGRVDILVNNAGFGARGDVVSTDLAAWDRTIDVNLTAPFLAAQIVIPVMLSRGGGTIVNVASAGGIVAIPDRAAYCAAKAGLIALTRSIAVDFARSGVRANCVAPGTIETEWIGRLTTGLPDAEAQLEAFRRRQIVERLGEPSEIADAVVYLASPRSSFMHGATLVVDGGWTIQ